MTDAERSKKCYQKRKLEEPEQHKEYLKIKKAKSKAWREKKKPQPQKRRKNYREPKPEKGWLSAGKIKKRKEKCHKNL